MKVSELVSTSLAKVVLCLEWNSKDRINNRIPLICFSRIAHLELFFIETDTKTNGQREAERGTRSSREADS